MFNFKSHLRVARLKASELCFTCTNFMFKIPVLNHQTSKAKDQHKNRT